MIVLYNAPRSSASRRVRLCLEEKGLPYENRAVDMERLEHHSAAYLKINPDGVVPTLLHDGRPLHETCTRAARSASTWTSPTPTRRCGPKRHTTAP